MIRALQTVDGESHICLTDKGLEVAENIYQRHTVLVNLLVSLGVDEGVASRDACKIEHVISEETYLAIKKSLDKSN